jgi:hypothetical protein
MKSTTSFAASVFLIQSLTAVSDMAVSSTKRGVRS